MTETTTGRADGGAWKRSAEAAWPYDGSGGTIAAARDATAAFLRRTGAHPGPGSAHDIPLLVVSELVTNAVTHAPGPLVLELRLAGDVLEIRVYDSHPTRSVERRPRDPERIGGHGLEIVAAVCEHVATEPTPRGKRVVARLRLG